MSGWRKFSLCMVAMGLVALLGVVGADVPPESIGHLVDAIGFIAAAFTGGNAAEHVARAVAARRPSSPPVVSAQGRM